MSIAEPTVGEKPLSRQGRIASAGLAAGPIVRLEPRRAAACLRAAATPETERAHLQAALAHAHGDLARLASSTTGKAADILAFQLALIEDDALTAPAYEAIAAGRSAEAGWQGAIGILIADYEQSQQEYFRARAADLRDLEGRVLDGLAGGGARLKLPEQAILVADDLAPSLFLSLPWEGCGIALESGSATSHVAMLARSRNVPMLVGLGPLAVRTGEPALLDATEGYLVVSPDRETERRFRSRRAMLSEARAGEAAVAPRPALTADGEAVEVHINIADPAELDGLDPAICDGIGLVRTELMFHGRDRLPDEAEQAEAYARILAWAKGRPVTIRTLDAGGDKPIPGLTIEGEDNPFLGVRGVRLSLACLDVFRVQLRALLRAAPAGRLKIMIPMVSVPEEMERVRDLLAQARSELAAQGVPHGAAALGMMVEVPAAALALDLFQTDFVSIGSNDLTQYTMAASRDSNALAGLNDAAHPAVQRLVGIVVGKARDMGVPVSLCGDAGADPRVLPHLLAAGLRSVSVPPPRVIEVKRIISSFRRERPRDSRPSLVSRLGRALGVSRTGRG
jgi:phosphotransferase system enzyme I (PtsI)